MKNALATVLLIGTVILLAAPAAADWNEGDPAKWIQLPDLTPNGMDIKANDKVTDPSLFKVIADDWLCNDPRAVTDIHIWGSWLGDQKPNLLGELSPIFHLDIWSDEPIDTPQGILYSRPKDHLKGWTFDPNAPTGRSYAEREYHVFGGTEGEYWYDPNTGDLIPNADKVVWQYNFDVFDDPFDQTPGEIYWLSVWAEEPPGDTWLAEYEFGWKTSDSHWNDDAVWADIITGGTSPAWGELRYPIGHPYDGQSIDMSFVITVPEPGTLVMLGGLGAVGLVVYFRKRRRK